MAGLTDLPARHAFYWKLNYVLLRPMLFLARLYRRTLARRTRVIAVVGSYGKTTTTRAVAAALGLPHDRWRDENANCLSLVPLTLLRQFPPHRSAVVEVGIGRSRQMSSYARALQPSIVVVTCVGSEHIQSYGSLESIRDQKAQMIRALPVNGFAVLNGDDPNVLWMATQTSAQVITYGLQTEHDVYATDVTLDWPRGTRFTLHVRDASFDVRTNVVGVRMVYPVLAAVAVGVATHGDLNEMVNALEHLPATPGRLQPMPLPGGAHALMDDYKSTIETVYTALDTLEHIPARRRLVVLGDLDSPPPPERHHYREVGKRVAQVADYVVFVGRKFDRYYPGVRAGGMPDAQMHHVRTVHDATAVLSSQLESGDVVLVKGREGQRLARVVLALAGRTVRCTVDPCRLHLTLCERCRLLDRPS